MVDSAAVERKQRAGSFADLLALRKRHFIQHANSRWEAKASIAYAIGDVLVGSGSEGIARLETSIVAALVTGDLGLCELLATGDALGQTPDRASTGLAALSKLGGKLCQWAASVPSTDEFPTVDDLHAWTDALGDILTQPARTLEARARWSHIDSAPQ
jgi:hypothetical protein